MDELTDADDDDFTNLINLKPDKSASCTSSAAADHMRGDRSRAAMVAASISCGRSPSVKESVAECW